MKHVTSQGSGIADRVLTSLSEEASVIGHNLLRSVNYTLFNGEKIGSSIDFGTVVVIVNVEEIDFILRFMMENCIPKVLKNSCFLHIHIHFDFVQCFQQCGDPGVLSTEECEGAV